MYKLICLSQLLVRNSESASQRVCAVLSYDSVYMCVHSKTFPLFDSLTVKWFSNTSSSFSSIQFEIVFIFYEMLQVHGFDLGLRGRKFFVMFSVHASLHMCLTMCPISVHFDCIVCTSIYWIIKNLSHFAKIPRFSKTVQILSISMNVQTLIILQTVWFNHYV